MFRPDIYTCLNTPARHQTFGLRLTIPKLHVHAKSKLIVTDQKTTCGTIVDGESIKGLSKELNKDEHIIQIGKYPHALRYILFRTYCYYGGR